MANKKCPSAAPRQQTGYILRCNIITPYESKSDRAHNPVGYMRKQQLNKKVF